MKKIIFLLLCFLLVANTWGQADIDRELTRLIDDYQASHNLLTNPTTPEGDKDTAQRFLIELFKDDKSRVHNHFFKGGLLRGIYEQALMLRSKETVRGLQISILPIRQKEDARLQVVDCKIKYNGLPNLEEKELYLQFYFEQVGSQYKITNIYRDDSIFSSSTSEQQPALLNAIDLFEQRDCEAARSKILAAANSGNAKAQYYAGKLYEIGCGVEENIDKAVEWYQQSAAQDYLAANFQLSLLHLLGDKIAKNKKEAFYWCDRTARKGYVKAFFLLAWMYENGIGTNKDSIRAANWYEKASKRKYTKQVAEYDFSFLSVDNVLMPVDSLMTSNFKDEDSIANEENEIVQVDSSTKIVTKNLNLDSISKIVFLEDPRYSRLLISSKKMVKYETAVGYLMGTVSQKGSYKKDTVKAIQLLYNNSLMGHAPSQRVLGGICLSLKDHIKALYWYEKAASQGNEAAIYTLGLFYHQGEIVPRDNEKAFLYLQSIEESSNIWKLYEILGEMYYKGIGTSEQRDKGLMLWEKAAVMGSKKAAFQVAEVYYGAEDIKKAIKYYRLAGSTKYSVAYFKMGEIYAEGKGVPMSKITAAKWYTEATDRGHIEASYALGLLYENCSAGTKYCSKYESKKLISYACREGLPEACTKLKEMR
ncbi:MAG: tetratricopeptide repeat protein [Bacteroidota bacterium]